MSNALLDRDARLALERMPERLRPSKVQICRRCILDSTTPGVSFDRHGICSHCRVHEKLNRLFPTGEEGMNFLRKVAEKIKSQGKGRDYDCIVGFSGGRDTSYCLYMVKQLGLNPLAVHFDNGWDSPVAKRNIARMCSGLDVDLHCVIADWEESRELTNCTIRASVPYIDLTDDVGIISALYRTAANENIRWIIHSHSYRTEGILPLKWNYVDARYARGLIRRFGKFPFKKFQNADLHHMLYWLLVKGIRVFTITNFYKDSGDEIDQLLKREFGWEDTGGWHFDNEIFGLQSYYARHKFGIDWNVLEYSAAIREGEMTREEALEKIREVPPIEERGIVGYALKKQGISWQEFEKLLAEEPKNFTDYPTYYPILRVFQGVIWALSRLNFLPPHTYEKYFEL